MVHTKYQGSRQYGIRQEDFFCFPQKILRQTCDRKGRGDFRPQSDSLNKVGRGPLDDASYQISRL